MTSAAVSPTEPPLPPMIRLAISVPFPSNFSKPSGVADVTALVTGCRNGSAKRSPLSVKNPPPTVGHVVIATGNAACRNARPTRAGLKTFWPSPPQTALPKPMPNAPPRTAIQSGMPAGSVSPSRSPVIAAEPSASDPP